MLKSLEEGQQNQTIKQKLKRKHAHQREINPDSQQYFSKHTHTYVRPMTYRYTDKKKKEKKNRKR